MSAKPILYGTHWCPKTSGFSHYLQREWVDFTFKNVEEDEAAAQEVKDQYEGKLKFPVLNIGDEWLKNPSIPELRKVLQAHELL